MITSTLLLSAKDVQISTRNTDKCEDRLSDKAERERAAERIFLRRMQDVLDVLSVLNRSANDGGKVKI